MTKPCHLSKPLHVIPNNLRIRTFQLPDDLKALVELREDVHHRTGEERVLRRLLELQGEMKGEKIRLLNHKNLNK